VARKPIHLEATGKLTLRDRIWAAVRALHKLQPDGFTRRNVESWVAKRAPAEATARSINENTIESYLKGLVAGAYLRRKDPAAAYQVAVYQLVRDVGVEAPRVACTGREIAPGDCQTNLWRAMKILKAFDWRELRAAAAVELAPATAKFYCQFLARAGYLKVLRDAKPGTPAAYRLVRNTGPRAPQIQRSRHLYDPNLGEVVWHPEVNS